jgi:hypothetical protein
VLLARELVVFDLELGQPACSKPLGGGRQPFSHLLGVFGEGVSQGGGDEGGCDLVYCGHEGGGLSIWTRTPGELKYSLSSLTRWGPARPAAAPGCTRAAAHSAAAALHARCRARQGGHRRPAGP